MSGDHKKKSVINRVAQAAVNKHLSRLKLLRAIVLANTGDQTACSNALDDLQREHQELLRLAVTEGFEAGIQYARQQVPRSTAQTRP